MTAVTAETRLIALLGDPVAHSLSPHFQNAAIRARGLNAVYVALRTGAESLPGLLRGIALAGGAGNVTVPHKRAAASVLDEASGSVRATGACNTFWSEDGRVYGDNTDVAGFRAAARLLLGAEPSGARVLVLGAGGAARAVLVGLEAAGASDVDLVNRTPASAAALAADVGRGRTKVRTLHGKPPPALPAYDLVVNATPLGLRAEDPDPLPVESLRAGTPVLDLVYRPGGTAWVRRLRERGHPAEDGTEMLVQQGAAAFEKWWGAPAPLAEMRAALPR
jgi:shikimate dehydrogenase